MASKLSRAERKAKWAETTAREEEERNNRVISKPKNKYLDQVEKDQELIKKEVIKFVEKNGRMPDATELFHISEEVCYRNKGW